MKDEAIITYDESSGLYTAFSKGPGGPVMSDTTKEGVMKKYEEGMRLCIAVQKLMEFNNRYKERQDK